MRTWLAIAVVSCLLPAAAAAQEANYPSKPVTIIVPAAPGGVTDALGRTLAQRFTDAWADIVAKINAEVRKIFADPEIKKNFLDQQYFESIAGTPEQLAKYIKADEPKWRKVIHDANVKGE
jgi:tripartite-type tricarboxylate transporter receptor subunit TctC